MTVIALPAPNTLFNFPDGGAPSAGNLQTTMTAAAVGPADENSFPAIERQILVAQNTHASTAYTINVKSTALRGRTLDLSAYSLAAGDLCHLLLKNEGYMQTDGTIRCYASNASVKFGVLRHPS